MTFVVTICYSVVMIEIGRRDFLHNTEKHIKPWKFILTRHKVPEYVVTFDKNVEKDYTASVTIPRKDVEDTYGCGICKKIPGQFLCKPHGRM